MRRQMFRCFPAAGAPHNFAGATPRRIADTAECPACDSRLLPHQGPASPSTYTYPLRQVASALVAVSDGVSYTEASQRARVRAGRTGRVDGQLAANWVEAFAPVVAAPYVETRWPETLVLDSTWFQVTNSWTGQRSDAFCVFAAYGFEAGATRGRLWSLQAQPSRTAQDWAAFLARLPGTPRMVISDHDETLFDGVEQRWPAPLRTDWSQVAATPFVFECEYHLGQRIWKRMEHYGHTGPEYQPLVRQALRTPKGWNTLARFAEHRPVLNSLVSKSDLQMRAQTRHRRRLPQHHSNASVEQALRVVKRVIGKRAYCFRNAERTNLLLELVRLRINRVTDEQHFTELIRDHLRNQGEVTSQGSCRDPFGPSLR